MIIYMNTASAADPGTVNRRRFFKASGLALGAIAFAAENVSAARADSSPDLVISGERILFQGDSITDAGRSRDHANEANVQPALGSGYAWLSAVELLVGRPKAELKIYNRGISGNKVFQLADRWQADCFEVRPTLISILIGVNDIWHALNGKYQGTVEIYERDYRALLERTRKELPQLKLVICEPFVLRCGSVNEKWFPEFDAYRAAARRVAESFDGVFIPFQAMFDEAIKYAPPAHWAADGVHPTPAGASLMAYTWLHRVAA